MWTRRGFSASLGVAVLSPTTVRAEAKMLADGEKRKSVAVAPFRGEGPLTTSALIAADLQRSGFFRLVDPPVGLDELSPLQRDAVRARQADALLVGSVNRLADGRWDFRYRLWDVVKGEPYFSRSMSVPGPGARLAAHRIADEVFERLTGERGVFATRIAYVTRAARAYALHVTDADGEGGQVALRSQEPIISPAWSPDGKELAYVSFETQKAAVWVQEVASGRRAMVANFPGMNSAPAWSPDGRELAVSLSRDGPTQLYLMTRSGGQLRRLTASGSFDTEPIFSPDGQTIYYVSDAGDGPQIYKISTTYGPPVRVTSNGGFNISPNISPDGSKIVYVSRSKNKSGIFVMDLQIGSIEQITQSDIDSRPSFAPNGLLVLYGSRIKDRSVLMTVTLDGATKSQLSSSVDVLEPAWGPWGR